MEQNNPVINKFFEMYASVSMKANPDRHADLYADEFIAAGPQGSAVFKNDNKFLEWLKQVYTINQNTGMESLQVISVQSNPIGDTYSFATVEWGAKFKKTGEKLVRFEISYLLQFIQNEPKILAYVDHEDQQKVMKELGLA
jgi:hypothetical protein